MLMIESTVLFVVGFISNLLSSLAGGGTGLLQFPALIFLGLPFTAALATHKVTTVAMGWGAAAQSIKNKNLKKIIILHLILAGLPGVLIGAEIVLYIPESIGVFSLGIMNILLGVYSFFKKDLGQDSVSGRDLTIKKSFLGMVVIFIIGVLNGSITSGTGLLVTIWLVIFYELNYRLAIQHMLVVVGILWNAVGATSLALNGEVNWLWVSILLPSAFLGSWLGIYLATKISNFAIKKVFEFFAVLSGIQLIISVL